MVGYGLTRRLILTRLGDVWLNLEVKHTGSNQSVTLARKLLNANVG